MVESNSRNLRGPAHGTKRENPESRPVLCVDDNDANRYIRTHALMAAGFEVIQAATGREALELAAQCQPSLVLLDIRLPDMDGFSVCERLKSDGRTRRIPVLHVTALGRMESDLPESLVHRSDAYLREPIDPETLVATVSALIRAREAEQRQRKAEARAAFYRRRTQRELAVTNRRLERALAAITEGSYVLDAEWRFTRLNPAAENYFGLPAAELLGRSIWDVTGLRDGVFWKKFHEAAESGRPIHFEAPSNTRPGFWADLHLHPVEGGLEVYFRDISGRKKAEEELQRQREWLRVTLGSITEAVIACDAVGAVQFLNDVAASLTGWTQQEALGQPVDQVFHAAHAGTAHKAADLFARVLREERPIGAGEQAVLISRDGHEIPIERRAAPIKDSGGNLLGVVFAFHDVTDERRAQEALSESERRYRELVQNANSAIVRWRRDGTATFFNEYAEQFFGYKAEEVVGKHVGFLVPETESTGTDLKNLVREIVAAPERFATFVNENLCRDGRRVWMAWTNRPIFDENGRVSEILAVGTDVTERKRAEEKVRQRNAVLEAINRIFATALECETEEHLASECLKVAEELTQSRFGFVAELGPGQSLKNIAISEAGWDGRRTNPADSGSPSFPDGFAMDGLYGGVIAGAKGFFTNDPAVNPDAVETPHGPPALRSFLGVPLKHGDTIIGMIGVGNRPGGYSEQDLESLEALAPSIVQVHMRQKAELAVQAGEERLRQAQKMESIGLLAGGVAHDFNNLLTGILGNASLLLEDVDPAAAERLGEIMRSAERAAQLTRQLLAYSGKGQFVLQDIDVSAAVHEIADLVQFSMPKSVELSIAVRRRLRAVRMDPSQLQQVLMNLVINAGEAIGEGNSGKVIIGTSMIDAEEPFADALGQEIAPGRYVCIAVSDTGCGIGAEQRSRIFDPFFTTKFAGRGLGLAAVAGIVRAQGGGITLDSAPGRGTTFRVFLRAVSEIAAAEHGEIETKGMGTVMIVDDEAGVRDFLAAALRRRGYRVVTASDGREALAAAKTRRVEAVILDLVMPVMSANELLPSLRREQPDARILLTSGYSESEARRLCAAYPDAAFLQKPYTAQKAVKALESLLQTRDLTS